MVDFKVDDEVCAFLESGGGYAEFVVVAQEHALRIPSKVSLVEAAAFPEASQFTIFALTKLTNVTLGKTVLIHETAWGIDMIAIQYVKHISCEVIAVAGVDIILDVSGRDNFQKNLDCVARGGSLVISGLKIGSRVDLDLSFLQQKDISVTGADMWNLDFLGMRRLWYDVAAKFWPR